MDSILAEIREILSKHGHIGQACVIERLMKLQKEDPLEFRSLIQGVDLWGGSGAVWEVGDLGEGTRRFQNAIIRLAEEMDHTGLGTEHSRAIAHILQAWAHWED